jgi:hypothetical protein
VEEESRMEHVQKMSKKKKLWFIVGAIALIVVIATVWIIWFVENRRGWEQVERFDSLEDFIHIEISNTGDGIVMVVPIENRMSTTGDLPLDKMILSEAEGWSKKMGSIPSRYIRRWNRMDAHIYNLVTKERIETIDVLQGLEQVSQDVIGYQLTGIGVATVYTNKEGEFFLRWGLENIPTSQFTPEEEKSLVLNLETREWSIDHRTWREFQQSISENERQRELERELTIFGWWDARPEEGLWFLSINGIEVTIRDSRFRVRSRRILGQVEIQMEAFQLPQENEGLYRRFPGLSEFIGREHLEVRLILNDFPTAQEILTLILEDGHEISFEGSVLRYDQSIDGMEHEINSFDDFFELLSP